MTKLMNIGRAAVSGGLCLGLLTLAGCGGGSSAGGTADATAAKVDPAASSVASSSTETASTLNLITERKARALLAAGYYVDAAVGSDANDGSSLAPFKTLARLSSVVLKTGDGIFLRCGSVWRESLVLTPAQLVDGSKLGSYGDDCTAANKPRITGANAFAGGWTKAGNVWSRPVGTDIGKMAKVFVNGVPLRTAQWPNASSTNQEWATTAVGAPSTMTAIRLSSADAAALSGKDLANAIVQVRSEPWFIERRTVTTLSSGELKLGAHTDFAINPADGFVLQDKLWMLDAPGEFFHDTANGVLYVYAADAAAQANLNNAAVEGMVRDVVLSVSGRAKLSVSNIRADMSRTDGVRVDNAAGAVLDGVDASGNLWAGVRVNIEPWAVTTARGGIIRNGRYELNANTGIDTGNALNVDIVSNVIKSTGMGQAHWSLAGIVAGDGSLVDRNIVEQSAFRGINFSGFGSSVVSNNVVTDFCLRLWDCAAIYTVNTTNRQGVDQTSTVSGNSITGLSLDTTGLEGANMLAGIYLDDLSRGVTVSKNILLDMQIGIYLHNASNNAVNANRIWRTKDVGLMAMTDHTNSDLLNGNVFSLNQIAPMSSVTGTYPALPQFSSTQAIRFLHALRGTESLTSGSNVFSGNQIVALNGDTKSIAEVGYRANTAYINAEAWRALNPAEPAPSSPAVFGVSKPTLGAELIPNGGFDSGLGAWTSWFWAGGSGGNVAAASGNAGCDGQCARVTVGNAGDRFTSPHFKMVSGSQYLISYKAIFGGTADINFPDIARPVTPWESFIDAQGLKSANTTLSGRAGDIIRVEAFFFAASNEDAVVNLRISTPGVPVAFDSVSLRPVIGYTISNFKDWGSIVTAPSDATKRVDCVDLGWSAGCSVIDIDGAAVTMPLTLPAGNTKLLLWANSPWRI